VDWLQLNVKPGQIPPIQPIMIKSLNHEILKSYKTNHSF